MRGNISIGTGVTAKRDFQPTVDHPYQRGQCARHGLSYSKFMGGARGEGH